jgi:hypothetical protein
MTSLVPLPATNCPSGQIAGHPLRTQAPQGTLLSHFNLYSVIGPYKGI